MTANVKIPKREYGRAQRLGVQFAHKHTADYPLIEEAKNEEDARVRRIGYLKGWGAALVGFKAGYLAGLRAKGTKR